MTEIKWQTPPPDGRTTRQQPRDSKWQAVADELRAHPGTWALVADNAHASRGTHIRQAKIPAFAPAGAFEVTTRNARPNRRVDIYVRFVGENGEYR